VGFIVKPYGIADLNRSVSPESSGAHHCQYGLWASLA